MTAVSSLNPAPSSAERPSPKAATSSARLVSSANRERSPAHPGAFERLDLDGVGAHAFPPHVRRCELARLSNRTSSVSSPR